MKLPVMLALIAATTLPQQASAEIYKCQINGKTVFMDTPCGGNAKPIIVRPATGSPPALLPQQDEADAQTLTADKHPVEEESAALPTSPVEDNSAGRAALKTRITAKEQERDSLSTELHTRLTNLEFESTQPGQEQRTREMIETLSTRYNASIETLNNEIKALGAEYDRMAPPPERPAASDK